LIKYHSEPVQRDISFKRVLDNKIAAAVEQLKQWPETFSTGEDMQSTMLIREEPV